MKYILITLLFSFVSLSSLAQSVTLEPGKSVFNQNTTESVEIKSSSAFPLTLRSLQPASGLPFYSNTNMFRGHIQGGVGGMIYSTPANHGHSFWTKNFQRMIIDSLGNIGIGTATPKYKFHLMGESVLSEDTLVYFDDSKSLTNNENYRIAFGKNGHISSSNSFFGRYLGLQAAYNMFLKYENVLEFYSSTQAVIRFENTNKVIINPIPSLFYTPAKADLDVNGTIRSSELDFAQSSATERRPVFADKDGILRVESSANHYISYDFSAVQAQDWDDQLRKGSGLAWFNTTNTGATMYLPVNLPDGVKVTNVRMYVLDNSASNISFTFNKFPHTSTVATTIATAQSSNQVATIFSINDDANEVVNNASNSYYVNISSSGNWTSSTLAFHSLVITYQY